LCRKLVVVDEALLPGNLFEGVQLDSNRRDLICLKWKFMKPSPATNPARETNRNARQSGPRIGTSIAEFETAFPDEAACKRHLFAVRFGHLTSCPWCGLKTSWWHDPKSATSACTRCRRRLHLKGQTVFHKTKLPLRTLFYAILLSANLTATPPNIVLSRHLGLSSSATQAFGRRLRAHLTALEAGRRIGGSGRIVHAQVFYFKRIYSVNAKGKARVPVLILSDGNASTVTVLESTRPARIFEAIRHRVNLGSQITAREPILLQKLSCYRQRWFSILQWTRNEGADGHNCMSESSAFKINAVKAIRRMYIRISVEWLDQYLGEQIFRFNHRGASQFLQIIAEFPILKDSILSSRTPLVEKI
jgi:hypothetical protein